MSAAAGPADVSVSMVDIAPTIARWLGVALPAATGAPIAALVATSTGAK